MIKDRMLKASFLISFFAHSLILFQGRSLHIFGHTKKETPVEVTYVKADKQMLKEARAAAAKNEPFMKMDQKITADNSVPPPYMDKDNIFSVAKSLPINKPDYNKPAYISPDEASLKKKITLPSVDLDKINNPSYISYYQIVREKIKRAAYQNYTRQDTGEVYLSFIIAKDGQLKDSRLVDEKSSGKEYLRQIALRSLKDASPFPEFPRNLDYPSLSFNIVISFEIE